MALGAYGSELGRGSVLNALAHPAVVNPLAAVNTAAETAGNVMAFKQRAFELQQAQLQPGYQAMRQLMATNPNPTNDDINAALGGAARLGGNVDGIVANLTDFTARGGKPADFVRAYSLGGMSPENQAQFGIGTPVTVDTGAGTAFGVRGGPLSTTPGAFTRSNFVQSTLSPAQATDMVQVGVNSDGSAKMVPRWQVQGSGAPGVGPGGGGGGGPGVSASAAVNNFGNIRAPGGGFASYNTPQAGIAAMASNLGAYQDQHGINTLNGITARWAPAGDGANNPAAYAQTISKLTGIDPNAKLDLHDPATLAKIIPAIAQVEKGSPLSVGSDVLTAGINAGNTVAAGPGGGQGGPFIGAASAQPVVGGGAVAQPGGGAGANVRPAGGAPDYDAFGRPIAAGGGYGGGAGGPPPGGYGGYSGLPATFEKTAGASADMFNNARASYAQQAQRISPLEQSLATLRAHPDLQTGMTAMDFQNLNSLAQVLGVQLSPQTIADGSALTEINKNLNRYYRGLPGANRSDMAELDAKLANPSPENQRDALQDLLARTIGTERMNDAGYMHFLELHGGGNASTYAGQYADQVGQYTSKLDPVGFAFDKMSVQERRAYWDSLSPTERTRYMSSIKEASRLYNLPIPQGG